MLHVHVCDQGWEKHITTETVRPSCRRLDGGVQFGSINKKVHVLVSQQKKPLLLRSSLVVGSVASQMLLDAGSCWTNGACGRGGRERRIAVEETRGRNVHQKGCARPVHVAFLQHWCLMKQRRLQEQRRWHQCRLPLRAKNPPRPSSAISSPPPADSTSAPITSRTTPVCAAQQSFPASFFMTISTVATKSASPSGAMNAHPLRLGAQGSKVSLIQ